MLLLVFIIAETFQPFLYSWRRTNQLFLAATGIEAAPSWQAQVLKFQRAFFPSFRWKKWCSSAVALRFGVWSYPGCACLFLLYPKRLISLLHLAATSTFVGIPPPHPSPFVLMSLDCQPACDRPLISQHPQYRIKVLLERHTKASSC